MAITPSTTVGRYRVLALVGTGSMGEVYRVEDTESRQAWALKMLPNALEGSDLWRRFMNEGQIHSQLQHANIPAFREMFLFQGRPCIVMEYVYGDTVWDRLTRLGRLEPREAARILARICDALAYLHSKNVVHRDLKSANVKITPDGGVKLLDFGIARRAGAQALTQVGSVMGTPETIAPELLHGLPANARSEVWGLGVLGYEMVTGELPFKGPTADELYRAIREQPPMPPALLNEAVDPAFEGVLLNCLEKVPSRRCSMRDLRIQLRICAGEAPEEVAAVIAANPPETALSKLSGSIGAAWRRWGSGGGPRKG